MPVTSTNPPCYLRSVRIRWSEEVGKNQPINQPIETLNYVQYVCTHMNTKYPVPPTFSTPATFFHPLPLLRSLLFPPQYSFASSFPLHSLFLLFFFCSFMLTVSWNLSASPSSSNFSPTINFYMENKHTAAFFTHT